MKNICVFCGSNVGKNPLFREQAIELAKLFCKQDLTLVYGAGNVGLMGVMANAMLENGGKVIGVIPEFLMEKEVGHKGLTELHIVPNMHLRKQKMAELADAFLTLPGGIGTLEELFEIFTWGQLAIHQKPFGILNMEGYYDALLQFLHHMVDQQFLSQQNLDMLYVNTDATELINQLRIYTPPDPNKWLEKALI